MTTCDRVLELLPWFANGSLGDEEAREIERHLAACEACRKELAETGVAFAIFDTHLSAETLAAIAFDDEPPSSFAQAHLADCEICSERLAMARASREELAAAEAEERSAAESGERSPAATGRPRPGDRLSVAPFPAAAARTAPAQWRSLAMAASLAAMVATTGWVFTWQKTSRTSSFRGGDVPAAEGAVGDSGPLLNVEVVELAPVLPGAEDAATDVSLAAPAVTLVLRSWLEAGAPLGCRLEAENGVVVWSAEGLVARADGAFALTLPTAGLSPANYRLLLLDAGGRDLESYAIRFR